MTVEPPAAVPVAVPPVHAKLTPVEADSVPGPVVAVNAVEPVLCHVTAPAVADITPTSDATAVTRTTNREILLMIYLLLD
ncbi:hypothetical protein [Baekduia sp. Peel2402]|uniref:hypothetical protein n=1 Tax=Baekduia sp. Peel2402 TaxID=3458296 RepID=UPI00403E6424